MRAALWRWSAVLVLAVGCDGGDDTRQEVVAKLRALGVAANPVVSSWSADGALPNEVELTVYAALPLSQTAVTVVPFKDPRQAALLTYREDQIIIDPSTLKVTAVGGLNLIEVKAKVSVPTLTQAMQAHALKPGSTGGQINYGFRLTSGTEEELVTGIFMAYATGSAELSWAAPTVQITEPVSGAALGKNAQGDLKATVANVNSEDIKLGWFTSGGEIDNRRAKETRWKRPDAVGPQTVVLTIRGKKSRGFSMQIVPVTTE